MCATLGLAGWHSTHWAAPARAVPCSAVEGDLSVLSARLLRGQAVLGVTVALRMKGSCSLDSVIRQCRQLESGPYLFPFF